MVDPTGVRSAYDVIFPLCPPFLLLVPRMTSFLVHSLVRCGPSFAIYSILKTHGLTRTIRSFDVITLHSCLVASRGRGIQYYCNAFSLDD